MAYWGIAFVALANRRGGYLLTILISVFCGIALLMLFMYVMIVARRIRYVRFVNFDDGMIAPIAGQGAGATSGWTNPST